MKYNDILIAMKLGSEMQWNDPDPIEGNDYVITHLWSFDSETAMIKYNGGNSEAEVPLSEIMLRQYPESKTLTTVGDLREYLQELSDDTPLKVVNEDDELRPLYASLNYNNINHLYACIGIVNDEEDF